MDQCWRTTALYCSCVPCECTMITRVHLVLFFRLVPQNESYLLIGSVKLIFVKNWTNLKFNLSFKVYSCHCLSCSQCIYDSDKTKQSKKEQKKKATHTHTHTHTHRYKFTPLPLCPQWLAVIKVYFHYYLIFKFSSAQVLWRGGRILSEWRSLVYFLRFAMYS
jgi:hypothetical protein